MESINRRGFIKTSAALSAAAGFRCSGAAGKPNIIFILADDLGYGDLGCYGQTRVRTPRLDRFAAEGLRFTQVYAGCTVCAPSRSCLMTGQHTGHTRIRGNAGNKGGVRTPKPPLFAEDITVAEVLKQAGYATGMIGKWGLGDPGDSGEPNDQGFDYWFGYLNQGHAHEYYPGHLYENKQEYPLDGKSYTHSLFTAQAKRFIREHAQEPFFLYLPYTIPHTNNELGRETGNGQQVPSDAPYSGEDWPQVEKNFAAMVTLMDKDIGEILDLLGELGIDDNTLIIFTSDNGPHNEGGHDHTFFDSNGSLRGFKRDLYEGGIRVPAMVRWSGTVAPGQTSDQVWAFWDFLPTAAELASVRAPDNIDGISMLPAFFGKAQDSHDYLYWEFGERQFMQAVRFGDWKAVRKGVNGPVELYDLSQDFSEERDIAGQHPDIVARAVSYIDNARSHSEDYPLPAGE